MVVVYVCVPPALVPHSKFSDIFPPESTLLAGWSLRRGYDDPWLWPPPTCVAVTVASVAPGVFAWPF